MTEGRRALFLALAVLAVAIAPGRVTSQPNAPPLATRLHNTVERVVLRLQAIEVRCRESVPETCGLSPGHDLAILRFVVRNHGATPYAGHIDLFSLLSPPTPPSTEAGFSESIYPPAGSCGAIDGQRYDPEVGLVSPIAAGRGRRQYVLFEIPRRAQIARVLYNDDDFPTCLSAPRVSYSASVCRAPRRRAAHMQCDYFER